MNNYLQKIFIKTSSKTKKTFANNNYELPKIPITNSLKTDEFFFNIKSSY